MGWRVARSLPVLRQIDLSTGHLAAPHAAWDAAQAPSVGVQPTHQPRHLSTARFTCWPGSGALKSASDPSPVDLGGARPATNGEPWSSFRISGSVLKREMSRRLVPKFE